MKVLPGETLLALRFVKRECVTLFRIILVNEMAWSRGQSDVRAKVPTVYFQNVLNMKNW